MTFFSVRLSGRSDFKVECVGSGDRWYGGNWSLSEWPSVPVFLEFGSPTALCFTCVETEPGVAE